MAGLGLGLGLGLELGLDLLDAKGLAEDGRLLCTICIKASVGLPRSTRRDGDLRLLKLESHTSEMVPRSNPRGQSQTGELVRGGEAVAGHRRARLDGARWRQPQQEGLEAISMTAAAADDVQLRPEGGETTHEVGEAEEAQAARHSAICHLHSPAAVGRPLEVVVTHLDGAPICGRVNQMGEGY